MPDILAGHHVILLPTEGYWDWVQAAREYAVYFSAFVTPRPEKAAEFHRPEQIVTVLNLPAGYPGVGDIVEWFRSHAPDVALDVLDAIDPAQLHQVFSERVMEGQRFGSRPITSPASQQPITLIWPTDYPTATQPFGANPDLYRRWGLPGHDGIDIRAPVNSSVYACADGQVYLVHDGADGHPYGIHVRIRHANGYKTIYAHLNQATVYAGQYVRAGELIGLADGTGNSSGSHLHLTLKKVGASASGETPFPNDIIDPTPYLVRRPAGSRAPRASGAWPYGRFLVGLHARAGGPMQEPDWDVVQAAHIDALLLNAFSAAEDVDRALEINPEMFVMARLSAPSSRHLLTAEDFVACARGDLGRVYDRGVRYFEVHSEPNVTAQGCGAAWRDGREFGEWFLEVVGLLRPQFPEARFGWPGLSPGPAVPGQRLSYDAFLSSAGAAVQHADWLGCHCYWENDAGMFAADGGMAYRRLLDEWPDRLVLVTEFSNPSAAASAYVKGNQYLQYYNHLRREPAVGAAFAFAVSAVQHYATESWRNPDGYPTPIVAAVSARGF
jgi:hypothetical protein